eukprot:scaffold428999_cov46-Prasinocladus_malaysianus.AAC.1
MLVQDLDERSGLRKLFKQLINAPRGCGIKTVLCAQFTVLSHPSKPHNVYRVHEIARNCNKWD